MKIVAEKEAIEDLEKMDRNLNAFFSRHIEKIAGMPPRRHLKHGLPYYAEDVTKQARLIYQIKGDTLHVIRCFALHKEYEKWYLSFK